MSLVFEIEDMKREAETLRSMVLAAYDAIYNGCTGYEEFDGQLHAVFCLAHDHSEHLKSLTDKVFEDMRGGKKDAERI